MKFRLLSLTEKETFGADAMAILDYTDVAALGAATDGAPLSIYPATTSGLMPAVGTSGTDTFAAGTSFKLVGMRLVTAFDCSGTGNLTLSVGYGGAETAFLAATQVALDQTEILYSAGTGTQTAFTTTDTVDAFFDSSGVNLSTYTSGEVVLYFRADDLNRLPTR
jgi:hypothetical protein